MTQETEIGKLNNSISDEDSKLVDSILNDLNNPGQPQGPPQQMSQGQAQGQMQGQMQQGQMQQGQMQQGQGQGPGQGELSPEQIKAIQMQRQQMAMQQQLMAQQQQMAAQQQAANQRMKQGEENTITPPQSGNIIDNIKNESKSIILVIFLSILLNLEQVDNLFKMQAGLFVSENGSINMQGVFIKALLIGTFYYVIKTYLL